MTDSASAEGDIGEFAARIAEAKVKKDNMKFSFPEPEFLKEIPKYDRTQPSISYLPLEHFFIFKSMPFTEL